MTELKLEGKKALGGGVIRCSTRDDEAPQGKVLIRTERPDGAASLDDPWWIGLDRDQVRELVVWLAKSLLEGEDD